MFRRKLSFIAFLAAAIGPVSAQQKWSVLQTLQACRQHSLWLKTESHATDVTKAGLVVARTRPNPEANLQPLQLTDRSFHAENTTYFSTANQQLWFQFTKNLQVAGQRRNKIGLAEENLRLREAVYNGLAAEQYRLTALKWLDAWAVRERIGVLRYETDDIGQVLAFLRNRGVSSESSEMIRASLLEAEYRIRLNTAQTELQTELDNLNLLVGGPVAAEPDTSLPFAEFGLLPPLDSLVAFAVRTRADAAAARQQQQVALARERLEKSNMWGQPTFGYISNPQNRIPYTGLFITVPFPLLDRKVGERQAARADAARAETLAELTARRVATEVRNAWRQYQTARQNTEIMRQLIGPARRDLERTKAAFFGGQTELNLLSFLEAERDLYEAQFMLLDSRLAEYRTLLQLLFASNRLAAQVEGL